jgi:hypothetical protein
LYENCNQNRLKGLTKLEMSQKTKTQQAEYRLRFSKAEKYKAEVLQLKGFTFR